MSLRLNWKKRRSRNRKRKNVLSTFQQVLKNGFYPNGFSNADIRSSTHKRNKKERNNRVSNHVSNRRRHSQNILDFEFSGYNRKRYHRKNRKRNRRKKILDSLHNGPLCKISRRKYRKNIIALQPYSNEKCDHNFRMSNAENLIPAILTPKQRRTNFRGIYLEKRIRKLPKLSPMLLSSERRSGYGSYGAHPGVNSIYVGKDDSGILWPLLGLFGLFQLLTTGAIGK